MRQILVATNFASSGAKLCEKAASLGDEFHARLTLMHVMEDYSGLGNNQEPIENNLQKLRDLIPKQAELQYIPETLVEFGHVAERILKAADEREADIIVLGARAYSDIGTTHLPSAAHHVIAHAHCPVLTIRE
jgi:nucleotide-binding universal stress UspA family protein